jgi:hypothetical protein
MIRTLSCRTLLTAFLLVLPALFTRAWGQQQILDYDCQTDAAVTSQGGWQGDSACGAGNSFLLFANHAYWQVLRLTPEIGDAAVETVVTLGERDGTADDAFSLLLHWSGSTDPSLCCESVHAVSGLRVLFSLDRNAMEVYQETAYATAGPLATLPFTLSPGGSRGIKIVHRPATLTLVIDDVPVGTVPVPATPPAQFGFDARGIAIEFSPITLTLMCDGDADCDRIADGGDNCPDAANPDQRDTDHDGAGDPCDADADGDGIANTSDSCPLAFNPGQEDADHDGTGDLCDTCPLDGQNDWDGDGLCSNLDNCPFHANPDQADRDADSEGDLCDLDDGFILVRWTDRTHLEYQPETLFDAFHLYRRNLADLRSTGIYVPDPTTSPGRTCGLTEDPVLSDLDPGPGRAYLYWVSGSSNGLDAGLGVDSSGAERRNDYPCGCLPMTRVAHATDGGTLTPSPDRRIDNLADWCAYAPSLCNAGLIDFNTEVALAHVADGRDSCADTEIACVEKYGTGVRVKARDIEYACLCTFASTTPYDIVKITRPATSATFSRTSIQLPCP